jgi:ABC-type dipeptide/oligopeptide/nickel transport system permease subunit
MTSQPAQAEQRSPSAVDAEFAPFDAEFRRVWNSNPLVNALAQTWRSRTGRIGVLIVAGFVFMALAAPVIAPHDPTEQFRGDELQAPSLTYLMGTDQLGRDQLSRVIYGARVSLAAGVLAVSVGASIGITSGLIAGYNNEKLIGIVIMRLYDGLLTFPGILLAIAIVSALGPGLFNVALAIGIAQSPLDARLTRSIVLSQREYDYVLAARSVGASGRRIAMSHIFPNTLPLLIIQLGLSIGGAVLAEGGLSFLGLGVTPPMPSWGGMLNDSRPYMYEMLWYAIWPGLALFTLLLGINFLSDALRDALDPKHVANR